VSIYVKVFSRSAIDVLDCNTTNLMQYYASSIYTKTIFCLLLAASPTGLRGAEWPVFTVHGGLPLLLAADYFDRSTLLCVRFKELTQVLGD